MTRGGLQFPRVLGHRSREGRAEPLRALQWRPVTGAIHVMAGQDVRTTETEDGIGPSTAVLHVPLSVTLPLKVSTASPPNCFGFILLL